MSRILFVMLHPGFIRYFEGGLQALADAGHDVHLAFEVSHAKLGADVAARRLMERVPRVTCGTTPARPESVRQFLARGDRDAVRSGASPRRPSREEAWESLATSVRLLQDYLRFFDPAFAGASTLRARAEKRLPKIYASVVRPLARSSALARRALAAWLRAIERLIPVPVAVDQYVRGQRPDALLVTPLIELGSQQVDYVKCARRLGIPSALCVASWDNLTSKGLVRVVPDRVIVWNEMQKAEAVALHGVAPDRVAVTGAQTFDRWFAASPGRAREEFCRMVGLDPARLFLVYVGSSMFIAPDEVPFVERWIRAVRRAADPRLSQAGILIRPHPANARQWNAFDLDGLPAVRIWPPVGTDQNAPGFWQDFHESLAYCAAVVGINTSAQIEAAIVGRPVFTIRAPAFAHGQDGTLHFRHLVGQDGPVRVADSLGEHVAQLAELVARGGPAPDEERARRAFVRQFVRPHGIDRPASPQFAAAVACLLRRPAPVEAEPAWVAAARPLALAGAYVARALAEDRPVWAYALRPVAAVRVHAARARYALGEQWRSARLPLKRGRRALWRAWYESTRRIGRTAHRLPRMLAGAFRRAGGGIRRALRRALP